MFSAKKWITGLAEKITWFHVKQKLEAGDRKIVFAKRQQLNFRGRKNKFGIRSIIVVNVGRKCVEELNCTISLPNGFNLEDESINPSSNAIKVKKVSQSSSRTDMREYVIPLLNSGEAVTIQLMSANMEAGDVGVSVRGRDVIGSPIPFQELTPSH